MPRTRACSCFWSLWDGHLLRVVWAPPRRTSGRTGWCSGLALRLPLQPCASAQILPGAKAGAAFRRARAGGRTMRKCRACRQRPRRPAFAEQNCLRVLEPNPRRPWCRQRNLLWPCAGLPPSMPSARPACRQHRGLDSPLGGAREHRLREEGSHLPGTSACRQQRRHQPRSNPAFVVLQGKTISSPQMREAHAMRAGLMLPMRIGMSSEDNPRNLWRF